MKRGAEKQLSKDDEYVEQSRDDSEPTRGFQKAEESTLATRQIRGLPKRLSQSPAPALPSMNGDSQSTPPPKFGGFSGFGAATSSPSPFSFTPPASSSASPSTSSFFGSSAGKPSQPSQPFFSNPPSLTPSASTAAKTFASVLSAPEPPDTGSQVDPAALKYYSSLRGLNVSFMTALSEAVDQNPFIDVANILERYRTMRLSVQKDFEKKSSTTPKTDSDILSAPKPAETKPSTAMPAPPSSFAGFGSLSSASSTAPSGGGFTPKTTDSTPAASSGFTFSSSSSSTPPSSIPAPATGFSFGASDSSKSKSVFGSSIESDSKPAFSFGKPSSSVSESTPSLFGSSSSGSKGSIFGTTFTAGGLEKSTIVPSSSATTNLFGGLAPVSNADKPLAPLNPFGSGFGSKPSLFAGFGKPPSGNIGNPVGFGFGSPPKTPDEGSTSTSKQVGFSFGVPPPKSSDGPLSPSDENGAGPAQNEEGEEGSKLLPSKPHDEEGEGEEDEVTTHSVKTKVFKLLKGKDGESKWGDMGVGVIRLKKHKDTEARRVLLRNSSTGKIVINFSLYTGLNPSLADKVISFVGHEEGGASATFKLRFKTGEQAAEFKGALEREIALAKTKSSD